MYEVLRLMPLLSLFFVEITEKAQDIVERTIF